MTAPLPPLRDVISRYGLAARKSLGQHFLLDGNITDKIAQTAGDLSGVNVVEVGPGPGGLTRSLLKTQALHIYAVEKDDRCVSALQDLQQTSEGRLSILAQDAMAFSIPGHVPGPRAIVANLPYNIATVLLLGWLEDIARDASSYRSLTLMFQKEVVERLAAEPGSHHYGRLSVMTQFLCKVEHCFDLPPGAFTPPPKVTSSIVRMVPLITPRSPVSKTALERTVKAAFGQRRKMLRSALGAVSRDTQSWLAAAGIDPTRRAETLSIEEFCELALHMPKE